MTKEFEETPRKQRVSEFLDPVSYHSETQRI